MYINVSYKVCVCVCVRVYAVIAKPRCLTECLVPSLPFSSFSCAVFLELSLLVRQHMQQRGRRRASAVTATPTTPILGICAIQQKGI